MMNIGLAFKALFCNRETAARVRQAFHQPLLSSPAAKESSASISTGAASASESAAKKPSPAKPVAARSDALTLVSTLQREARFLDLVQEPLNAYSDAQVGAAARDVIRDTSKTLERLFAIRKLVEANEGETIELPQERSLARWKSNSSEPAANQATLVHPGWQATKCELPQWTGSTADAFVLAPAEFET
jgi:hypothetical protein